MATQYPASLDAFGNPAGDTSQAQVRTHSQQHSDENDAIEALEAKVGIDGSLDPESLDYKVRVLRIGGWRTVATIDDRNAIPKEQLALGMIVIVTSDQYPVNNISWQLTGFDDTGNPIWTDMGAPTDAKLAALQADVDKDLQDLQTNVDKELQEMQASVDETEADINKKIDDVIAGQSSNAIYATDWNSGGSLPLSTLSPNYAGQGAFVPASDTGTHTDGVTGATVANAGSYTAVSVSGVLTWKWLRADTLADKASKEEVEDALLKKVDALPQYRTTNKFFRWAVLTRLKEVLIGIDRKYRLWVSTLRLQTTSSTYRTTRSALFSIADAAGKRVFAVLLDGTSWLQLNDSVIADIKKRLNIGVVAFRGNDTAVDVSSTTELIHARVVDGTWFGPVTQTVDGALDSAIADHAEKVDLIEFYGQSNAGGGGTAATNPPKLTTALYKYHALSFSTYQNHYGTVAADASQLTDISPIYDKYETPYPAVATAFAIENIARYMGENTPGVFAHTDWYGSQPLSTFVRGKTTWDNSHLCVGKAIEILRNQYGRDASPHIVWAQGEAGPTGRETHAAALESLISDYRGQVFSDHGVWPSWIIWQICYGDCVTGGVTLAHRDVALAHQGVNSKIVLAGPTYATPWNTSDYIHYTAEGRMMQGEVTALVVKSINRTGTWIPLSPISITRNGVTVVVDFYNPGQALKIDTDWIEATTNYGFSWSDDSGSASVSSAAITGESQVTITLTNAPTGANGKLQYGLEAHTPTDLKWSAYRGQLYASSGIPSPYNQRGYTVPSDIRFYCVTFEESVA